MYLTSDEHASTDSWVDVTAWHVCQHPDHGGNRETKGEADSRLICHHGFALSIGTWTGREYQKHNSHHFTEQRSIKWRFLNVIDAACKEPADATHLDFCKTK